MQHCPMPPNARAKMAQVEPGDGLLLLLFALSQGRRSDG
jgi:TusA-related sulfurtransferase